MKRINNLLIMCGVLVVLVVALILSDTLTENKTENTPLDTDTPISSSYTAAKLDLNTLYSIKYNLGDIQYSFSLNDTETLWLWSENSELPLDNTYFASMAKALKSVISTVKMTGKQSTLMTYGLDTPWLTVTVSDETNGIQTFMFGNLNSFNSQYYFMTAAEQGIVYMVDSSVAEPFDYSPYDMIKKDTLPEIDPASIRQLSFKSETDEWIYSYYENGKDNITDNSDYWYVSKNSGNETPLDEETGAALPFEISGITFTDIAGYSKADKKALGLADPIILTVSYIAENVVTDESGSSTTVSIDSTLTLHLGYADGTGKVYAALPDSVLSYRINGSIIADLYSAIISPASN